ncbi:MAG: sugar ABC transporter permease [Spirochaetales bacterium]|nr:sugar ABC transporter permease [Spirochaetales bacterium]
MIRKKLKEKDVMPYVCLIPFMILFLTFFLIPIIYSLVLSFQKLGRGSTPPEFAGLQNYAFILTEDTYFWRSISATVFLLFMGTLLPHLFAFPLAIMLNNKSVKLKGVFKVLFFLPFMTNTVSAALIFQQLFSLNYGVINFLMGLMGLDKINWQGDPNVAPLFVAILVNWRYIGWNTILYFAGLQGIPKAYYEAADIDGASTFEKHLSITLPQLLPIIFFAVSLSIITGLQLFDEPFILSGQFAFMGGVKNSCLTVGYYIVWLAQKGLQQPRGAAVSWVLTLLIVSLTYINWIITRKLEGRTKERPNAN